VNLSTAAVFPRRRDLPREQRERLNVLQASTIETRGTAATPGPTDTFSGVETHRWDGHGILDCRAKKCSGRCDMFDLEHVINERHSARMFCPTSRYPRELVDWTLALDVWGRRTPTSPPEQRGNAGCRPARLGREESHPISPLPEAFRAQSRGTRRSRPRVDGNHPRRHPSRRVCGVTQRGVRPGTWAGIVCIHPDLCPVDSRGVGMHLQRSRPMTAPTVEIDCRAVKMASPIAVRSITWSLSIAVLVGISAPRHTAPQSQ
jgi:hypothetical protein